MGMVEGGPGSSDIIGPMWCLICSQVCGLWDFPRQEYWSGLPFSSPEDLPDPGIEPRSPASQTDSLLTELRRKPHLFIVLHLTSF